MTAPSACPSCVEQNLSCVFPERSEQCYRCREFAKRCEGSTNGEEYEQTKKELEDLQEQMDNILEQSPPNGKSFSQMKKQWRMLSAQKLTWHNRNDSTEYEKYKRIETGENFLRKRLEAIREHSFPADSEYQDLLSRRCELQNREDLIMERWDIWLNETNEMTDYPHYRGLPMPEKLDEEQWKEALMWAQKHPDSHRDYPSPSLICYDSDDDDDGDGMAEMRIDPIRSNFRQILQDFYPLFDMLVEYKTLIKASQAESEPAKAKLNANDNFRIRYDLVSMTAGVKLVQNYVDYMEQMLKSDDTLSCGKVSQLSQRNDVVEQFKSILHDLHSLSTSVADCEASNTIYLSIGGSVLARKRNMRTGIRELRHYLSKLTSNLLLFPK